MVKIILFLFFLFLFASFALYVFYQFFKNFKPSSNKIVTDLKIMKQEVEEAANTLISWTKEEMAGIEPITSL